ncbi:unnamed protein product [Vitrella brassicaformis CCMP3155]|uniref:ubiquitinyl hydrolase 1 n=8 Tax=Vitrella brassicaformis TaxID=1169539 RepID=A0A0G4ELH6_VITBC|nr:unnamed protein product [Vitrella brassicaformis CCMP3155]|eukprot:CEL97859.1 unnamed protein product [Vitrella brassicaformis CCMP3155]
MVAPPLDVELIDKLVGKWRKRSHKKLVIEITQAKDNPSLLLFHDPSAASGSLLSWGSPTRPEGAPIEIQTDDDGEPFFLVQWAEKRWGVARFTLGSREDEMMEKRQHHWDRFEKPSRIKVPMHPHPQATPKPRKTAHEASTATTIGSGKVTGGGKESSVPSPVPQSVQLVDDDVEGSADGGEDEEEDGSPLLEPPTDEPSEAPLWRDAVFQAAYGLADDAAEPLGPSEALQQAVQALEFASESYTHLATALPAPYAEDADGVAGRVQPFITSVSGELRQVLDSCRSLTSRLLPVISAGAKHHTAFYTYVVEVVARLRQLASGGKGGILVAPVGWLAKGESADSDDASVRLVYLVITKADNSQGPPNESFFDVSVISSCDSALGYHPVTAEATPATAQLLYLTPLPLRHIKAERLIDGNFWTLVLRLLVHPQPDEEQARILYDILLPSATHTPGLYSSEHGKDEALLSWSPPPPVKDDPTNTHLTTLLVRETLLALGLTRQEAAHLSCINAWAMCERLTQDITKHSVTPRDAALLSQAARHIAVGVAKATQQSTTDGGHHTRCRIPLEGRHLAALHGALERLNDYVEQRSLHRTERRVLGGPTVRADDGCSDVRVAGWEEFDLMGGFRRDEDVDKLAGEAKDPPVLVPVQLTDIPEKVVTFADVSTTLRKCVRVCTLLANQRCDIDNSAAFRLALIQHLVTKVLPVPLPLSAPDRPAKCFWASQQITRAVQHDILRHLHLIGLHLVTASLSVIPSRPIDASRLTSLAALATLADATVRLMATDDPSGLSRHYGGYPDGRPFWFDLTEFASESEYFMYAEPHLAIVRWQVLEYLTELKGLSATSSVGKQLFRFEDGMAFDTGTAELLNRLAVDTAFSTDETDLAQYYTGEKGGIATLFPELGYLRDLVFYFKALLNPTSDQLPAIRSWDPESAAIQWSYTHANKQGKLAAFAFDKSLECARFQKDDYYERRSSVWSRMWEWVGLGKAPRVPPSKADPATLLPKPQKIESEDDLLHVRDMPTFGGEAGQKGGLIGEALSEQLLSFLTVPYLRIPLVMTFLADAGRVDALTDANLQGVVAAALFEPGGWCSSSNPSPPTQVPTLSAAHIATPLGLLLNELTHSPATTLTAIDRLLQLAMDKDTGRYKSPACRLLLFVVRIMARVLAFVKVVRERNREGKNDGLLAEWEKRATEQLTGVVARLLAALAFRAVQDQQMGYACAIHAHLVLIFCREMGDAPSVAAFVSSLVFVMTHHRLSIDVAEGSTVKRAAVSSDEDAAASLMGLPEWELIEVFQTSRHSLIAFMKTNPTHRNTILEQCVQLVSFASGGPLLADAGSSSSDAGARSWVQPLIPTHWEGRFVPQNELPPAVREGRVDVAMQGGSYESWLKQRVGRLSDSEMNLQLGDFSLRSQQMKLLGPWVNSFADFRALFGGVGADKAFQCAEVRRATKRLTLQLVAERYTLEKWRAPDGPASLPSGFKKRYRVGGRGLTAAHRWALPLLDPFIKRYLTNLPVYLSSDHVSDPTTLRLAFLATHTTTHKDARGNTHKTTHTRLREIHLKHTHDDRSPFLELYDVQECGRRHYRSLVYSTNASMTLHNPSPVAIFHSGRYPVLQGGLPAPVVPKSDESLVIQRTVGDVVQEYVPPRFLAGLLPSALIEAYEFWQKVGQGVKELIGYQLPHSRERSRTPSILLVTVHPSHTHAFRSTATVTRHTTTLPPAGHLGMDPAASRAIDGRPLVWDEIDREGEAMVLMNAQRVIGGRDDCPLKRLLMVVMRLENLSHVLVWREKAGGAYVVEMPRVDLTFTGSGDGNGAFYCEQHSGLFVSRMDPLSCDRTRRLLAGLPNVILLESSHEELYLLMAATGKPIRVRETVDILFNREDSEWGEAGMRHFLYPIHVSRTFVFIPTAEASLWMLLMRLMSGQYEEVFSLSETACVVDGTLTDAQQLLWDAFMHTLTDRPPFPHPDIHALRLKLLLNARAAGAPARLFAPISATTDVRSSLLAYVRNARHISAECRLTADEQSTLFAYVGASMVGDIELVNRRSLLDAVKPRVHRSLSGAGMSLGGAVREVDIKYPSLPALHPFDRPSRGDGQLSLGSWLDQALASVGSIGIIDPARPSEGQHEGPGAIEWLDALMGSGGAGCVGLRHFFVFYDLMTSRLPVRILPDDSSHKLGGLLLRFLPPRDFSADSGLTSVLRAMAADPSFAKSMPIRKTEEDNKDPGSGSKAKKDTPMAAITSFFNVGAKKERLQAFFADLRRAIETAERPASDDVAEMSAYVPPRKVFVRPFDHPSNREFWYCYRGGDNACGERVIEPFSVDHSDNGASYHIDAALLHALFTKPMAPIDLSAYVNHVTQSQLGHDKVSAVMPFHLSNHSVAKTPVAVEMRRRLKDDLCVYADGVNKGMTPVLIGLMETEIPSTLQNELALTNVLQRLKTLYRQLTAMRQQDQKRGVDLMQRAVRLANRCCETSREEAGGPDVRKHALALAKSGGHEPSLAFDALVALLTSQQATSTLQCINPLLSPEQHTRLLSLTAVALLLINRTSQSDRCLRSCAGLMRLLASDGTDRSVDAVRLRAGELVGNLCAERHYGSVMSEGGGVRYDPRLLVFEFASTFLLREAQTILIDKFVGAASGGQSLCHQMIMGAGKTTVVGPLLSLLLGSDRSLIVQVVPHALLEFTRSVLRERFSAMIRKPILTFHFDRYDTVTPELLMRLQNTRENGGVMICDPTSLKSFMLKTVELLLSLDRHAKVKQQLAMMQEGTDTDDSWGLGKLAGSVEAGIRKLVGMGSNDALKEAKKGLLAAVFGDAELSGVRDEVSLCFDILMLFRSSTLILDEVDLILHPLKSELNWPIGLKYPLDFTRPDPSHKKDKRASDGVNAPLELGVRWQMPWHLLDAIVFCQTGKMTVNFQDSSEALRLLQSIREAISHAAEGGLLQRTPHLILLSTSFYHATLKPLLAKWLFFFLRSKRLTGINDETALRYLTGAEGELTRDEGMKATLERGLSDFHMKMLNLGREWLHSLMPHVLAKVNRVSFGYLRPADIVRLQNDQPLMPRSRRLLAVPFVGKDVPSRASEFSHPDVVIGLTILAYRLDGLRMDDFRQTMSGLKQTLEQQVGPVDKRPASLKFNKWVDKAGGRVRGSKPSSATQGLPPTAPATAPIPASATLDFDPMRVWPLALIDLGDTEQMDALYGLLQHESSVIWGYLHEYVFPVCLEHTTLQLSACGQDLGGSNLFGTRLGFSGTPSNLIPRELGLCQYEQGTDGKILTLLTSPRVVTHTTLEQGWGVAAILKRVANGGFHALIDTGALITGLSNLEVARRLLAAGLKGHDGVVFLDSQDRQMVLMREGGKVLPLAQCGLSWDKRFTFYDQIHTTGMDIKQAISARAALTIGKDMTLRDYSQGAFRMRGIGNGQTLQVLIPPEVARLIAEAASIDPPSLATLSAADVLSHTAGWLTLQSMRSEKMQFDLLCEQDLCNVWRRRAFELLREGHDQVGSSASLLSRDKAPHPLALAVDTFRDRIDFTVPNTVEASEGLGEKLRDLMQENDRILTDEDRQTCGLVLRRMEGGGEGAGRMGGVMYTSELVQQQEEEQEKEQEQEQEQEEEKEKEEEKMTEPEVALPLKYSRDDENPIPWPITALSHPPAHSGAPPFYPLSEFAVLVKLLQKPKPLDFPHHLSLSQNHYRQKWSLQTFRRLKNVLVVLEWIPDTTKLGSDVDRDEGQNELTDEQEDRLRKAFELFDTDNDRTIDRGELVPLLRAMEMEVDDSMGTEIVQLIKSRLATDGQSPTSVTSLSFDEIRTALADRRLLTAQEGRHFVVLSLAEAQTIRVALHATNGRMPDGNVAFALRALPCGFVAFDSSSGFGDWKRGAKALVKYQEESAAQCCRFVNSEHFYTPKQLAILLRALQPNDCKARQTFFLEVRRCRRRAQLPWEDTPLAQLFATADDFAALKLKAVGARVRQRLYERGMSLADAFMAFDHNRDGVLSGAELYGGLKWLGVPLTPEEVRDVITFVDHDANGFIQQAELLDAFGVSSSYLLTDETSSTTLPSPTLRVEHAQAAALRPAALPRPPASPAATHQIIPVAVPGIHEALGASHDPAQVIDSGLRRLQAALVDRLEFSIERHDSFHKVWTSEGSTMMMPTALSLWEPDELKGRRVELRKNRLRLCVGHYASTQKALVVEAHDLGITVFNKPREMTAALELICPQVIRFKQVWANERGSHPLYVWRGVPPSDDFVTLGLMVTSKRTPPKRSHQRCIPRKWVRVLDSDKVSAAAERLLDSESIGAGARPGCLWSVPPYGLLAFTEQEGEEFSQPAFALPMAFKLKSADKAHGGDAIPDVIVSE